MEQFAQDWFSFLNSLSAALSYPLGDFSTQLGLPAATAVILGVINLVIPIRVPSHAEEAGLDLAQHGEVAYQL